MPHNCGPRQIHFNSSWFYDYDPAASHGVERQDRYRLSVAYSQSISSNIAQAAGIYRKTGRERDCAVNLAKISAPTSPPRKPCWSALSVSVLVGTGPRISGPCSLQHSVSYSYSFDPPF